MEYYQYFALFIKYGWDKSVKKNGKNLVQMWPTPEAFELKNLTLQVVH
jgi:hypothetical protein